MLRGSAFGGMHREPTFAARPVPCGPAYPLDAEPARRRAGAGEPWHSTAVPPPVSARENWVPRSGRGPGRVPMCSPARLKGRGRCEGVFGNHRGMPLPSSGGGRQLAFLPARFDRSVLIMALAMALGVSPRENATRNIKSSETEASPASILAMRD